MSSGQKLETTIQRNTDSKDDYEASVFSNLGNTGNENKSETSKESGSEEKVDVRVFRNPKETNRKKLEQATLERLQSIAIKDNIEDPCYTQDYIKDLEKIHLEEKTKYLIKRGCCDKPNCKIYSDDLFKQLTNCRNIYGHSKRNKCLKLNNRFNDVMDYLASSKTIGGTRRYKAKKHKAKTKTKKYKSTRRNKLQTNKKLKKLKLK